MPTEPSPLTYTTQGPLATDEFIDVLRRSTLGERRPTDDRGCMEQMVRDADLTVTARDADGLLVGVARSVTDFGYCCYLSDLAVDSAFQRQGIGLELIRHTREALGPRCKLILLSAPAAVDYYPRIGFERHPHCYVIDKNAPLG